MNNTNLSSASRISENITSPSLQFAFGILGNVLALVMLVKTSNVHQWKPFYGLVGGLAVTDLSAVAFTYPFIMVRYGSGFTYNYSQEVCNFLSFVFTSTLLSSAMIVTAMSVERFLAVVCPFFYARRFRGKQAALTLLCIWVTSGIICSLHLLGFGSVHLFYPGSWCFFNFYGNDIKDQINSLLYCCVGIMMLVATFVLNMIVIYTLMRKNIFVRIRGRNTKPETNRSKDRDEALVYTIGVLLAIVIIFMVCWIPIMSRIVINVTLGIRNRSIDLLAARLMIANTLLDPWVYVLARRNILTIVIRKLKCIPNSRAGESSMSMSQDSRKAESSINTVDTSFNT